MIDIVALCVGLKWPCKIHLNTQSPFQILAEKEVKPFPLKLDQRILKLSYGPEEEEERKEALTLAHIRVHIFVSNLRISVAENRNWLQLHCTLLCMDLVLK